MDMIRTVFIFLALGVGTAQADCIMPNCNGTEPIPKDGMAHQGLINPDADAPTQFDPFHTPFVETPTTGARCLIVLPHAHMKAGEEAEVAMTGINLSEEEGLRLDCKVAIEGQK